MSEPRILSIKELKLVQNTNGSVIGINDSGGSIIWIQDIVHTALTLYDLNGKLNKEVTRLQGVCNDLESALTWVLDDLIDAGEDRNPETQEVYDSVAAAQKVLLDMEKNW